MRVTRIEREIAHKIFLGGYETIEPKLRMVAELDDGDDVEEVQMMLDQMLEMAWVKEAISELRMVRKRRQEKPVEGDVVAEQLQGLKGTLRDV